VHGQRQECYNCSYICTCSCVSMCMWESLPLLQASMYSSINHYQQVQHSLAHVVCFHHTHTLLPPPSRTLHITCIGCLCIAGQSASLIRLYCFFLANPVHAFNPTLVSCALLQSTSNTSSRYKSNNWLSILCVCCSRYPQ